MFEEARCSCRAEVAGAKRQLFTDEGNEVRSEDDDDAAISIITDT